MPEAEVLYSDVKFRKTKENVIETASSSADTTYSEVRILKTQPNAELPGSQQVESNGGSKVKSEKVALLILYFLLAVVVIALCYVSYDNMQTKKSLQTLKTLPPSCPKPEIKASNSCLKCGQGWVLRSGKCYYFSTEYLSWEKSRHHCQSRGGDLVKIDSRKEQIFLQKELSNKMNDTEDKFWIGLTDSKEENKWFWVDGSPLNTSLSFWRDNEPDDWKKEDFDGEDCVRMGEKGGDKNLKSWSDKSCQVSHRGICQKQTVTGVLKDACF